MKVRYTRMYRRSVREAQRINSDVGAKGSVEQNRGLTNRNLILRLHRPVNTSKDKVTKQTKV